MKASAFSKIILFPVFFFIIIYSKAQIEVSVGHNANELVQMLLGQGVTISNITGSGLQSSSNPNIWQAGKFNGGLPDIGIDSGIVLTSGNALLAQGPNNNSGAGYGAGNPGDPMLTSLAGVNTNDACIIEFDFTPYYDTIVFRYVFGSEEYHQYVTSYNDIFAFFISGPNPMGGSYNNENIALIPGTNLAVSMYNINFGNDYGDCPKGNSCINCEYLIDNCESGTSIEYDAYTVVFTAMAVVIPCQTYHLKLAIADALDSSLDTGVFLEAGSFSSPGITITPQYSTAAGQAVAVEGCSFVDLVVSLPMVQPDTVWLVFDSIRGTATNGVDCNFISDSIFIPPGELSNFIHIVPVYDGEIEPLENFIFYFSSTSCSGTQVDSVRVDIADWNPVDIGSDTIICEGQFITFDAGEGYRIYLWQDGSSQRYFTTNQAGTISVTVYDVYQCPSFDALQLNVAPLPQPLMIKHN